MDTNYNEIQGGTSPLLTPINNSPVSHHVSETKQEVRSSLWGIAMVVVSSIFTSFMCVCAKYAANKHVPAFQVALFRMGVQAFFTLAMLQSMKCTSMTQEKLLKTNICPSTKWFLLLSGILYVTSISCFQLSLGTLDLSTATVIYWTMPMWTAILSWTILCERPTCFQTVSVVATVAGAFLVAHPKFLFGTDGGDPDDHVSQNQRLVGIGVCLVGSLTASLFTIVVRQVSSQSHPFVISFYSGIVGSAVLPIFTFALEHFVNPSSTLILLGALLGCGIFTMLSTVTLNVALQYESPTLVSVIRTSDILFNIVWDIVLFWEVEGWMVYCGASLITAACLLATFDKARRSTEVGK